MALIWLALPVLLPVTWSQELHYQTSSCDRKDLEADFNIESCYGHLSNIPLPSRLLNHGSRCSVRFRTTRKSALRYCYNGNWDEGSVKQELAEIFKRAPRIRRELHSRKKRGFWRAVKCWLFGCRRGPPPDRTPPTLRCPGDLTAYNTPLQTHAYFSWREPVAVDNRDGHIMPLRDGPGPGDLIATNATVRYVARDSSGNMASCSFRINIIVIRCPAPQKITDGYFRCHPSTDFVMGGNCVFGCYNGHVLEGPKEVSCQDTWRWSDGFPVCRKIECPLLFPVTHAVMHCSDGFKFRSVCTFTCSKEGYDIPVGQRRVQVCRADGTWSGQTPSCVDTTPPTITQCPYVVKGTADKSSDKTRVFWSEPKVEDNSGEIIPPVQTKGKPSGSIFTIGYHDIEYTAKDSAGNVARKCHFKVVVKELTCHALYATPFQTVSCPQGYRYGSKCTFECDPDFALAGSPEASCGITGFPSYGVWLFPKQPTCEVASPCPRLRVPAHGAIVCDEWLQGTFCQLQCQNGTDISPRFPHWDLFVCGSSGIWNIIHDNLHNEIPDCVVRGASAAVTYVMGARYYFSGNCNDPDVQREIKTNFISKLENHPACQNFPECEVGNVKVLCGETRKRRETADNKLNQRRSRRDTSDNRNVEIEIEFRYDSRSANKSAIDAWKSRVYTVTSDAVHSPLTVGGLVLTSGSVTTSEIDGECENGSVVDYKTMSCMKCPPGSFHNLTGKSCDLCPKGHYQAEEGQTSCKDCTIGRTTRSPGAKDATECQASCPSGTSSRTGLPPCSPCPHGFYQPGSGQTKCEECPGVKTTVTQGSVSVDRCQDFDMSFEYNDTSHSPVAILDVDINVTSSAFVSLWMQCTNDCRNTTVLTVSKNNDENWLVLVGGANLTLSTDSLEVETASTLDKDRWYFILFEVNTTSLTLWVDGTAFGTLDIPGITYINIQKLTLGGNSFTGRMSQVQIWSPGMFVSSMDRTCSGGTRGDIVSWKHFTDAKLQGAYLDIPSLCDDFDSCATNPCANGQCQDDLDSFSCHCDLGWSGRLCDVNNDDCVDNSCENNSTCVDDINAYHCACAESFSGEFCEIAIVDGQWGIWSNWTSCNVTCGQGSRTRSRMCDDPYPDNGGKECEGEATEVELCQLPDCIVCPKLEPPTNGNVSCDVTSESTNCSLFCAEGYMFDKDPLDQYTCSADSLNAWSHVTELNPLGRVPYCSQLVPARRLSLNYSVAYLETETISCSSTSGDISSIKTTLSNVIRAEIGCIGNQLCNMSEVEVKLCQGRTKRDTSSNMHISVEISVDSGTENTATVLETAYRQLQQTGENGLFSINVNNLAYHVDINTTSSSPTVYCGPGHTTYSFWCLPCGPGSYYKDGVCEWCPVGTYQSMEAQVSCVSCVQGWTTVGYGSRTEAECDVRLPTTTSTTTASPSTVTASTTAASSAATGRTTKDAETTTSTTSLTTTGEAAINTSSSVEITTTKASTHSTSSSSITAPTDTPFLSTALADTTNSETEASTTATKPALVTTSDKKSSGEELEDLKNNLIYGFSSALVVVVLVIVGIVFVVCRSRRKKHESHSSNSSLAPQWDYPLQMTGQITPPRGPSSVDDDYEDMSFFYPASTYFRRGSKSSAATSNNGTVSHINTMFEKREIYYPRHVINK